ncbi:MAG: clostripain-related cysteine peptidase [Candidatus Cloacimonadaceae bacterium]|nr:clostripain-related cysteine peptidase [Candidatus Cloacimonadaceae bacterium]
MIPLLIWMLFLVAGLAAETWTVLIYMAADNNLWQNGMQDINDMESVPISSNLNLIVQADFSAFSALPGTRRYRIQQDSSPQITSPVLGNLGTVNSADPLVLKEFIRWGFSQYPSRRKMLVIWSHADSWFKNDNTKWICTDDDAEALMSVANGDLDSAFSGMPKLDILLFDACSMQSLEVLAEVKDKADYVIASAELVPVQGFPYQTMIPLFHVSSSIREIVESIPNEYLASYDIGGVQNPNSINHRVTCSSIETAPLAEFLSAFKSFSMRFKDRSPELLKYRNLCWEMNTGYNDVDVAEWLFRTAGQATDPLLAQDAMTLYHIWANCVAESGSIGIPHANIGTAAIWFPWHRQYFDGWWSHYHKLKFAGTRWLALLNRAYGDDATAPRTPVILSQSTVLGTLQMRIRQSPDPDSLYYEVRLEQGGDVQSYLFYPSVEELVFSVFVPIRQAGIFRIRAIDTSGNVSDYATSNYQYSAPGFDILVAPNPISSRNMASLRWFVPDEVSGNIRLRIYNIRGRRVLENDLGQARPGEGIQPLILLPGFEIISAGRYVLEIKIGKRIRRQIFTIL